MGEKVVPIEGVKKQAALLSERLGGRQIEAYVPLTMSERAQPLADNLLAALGGDTARRDASRNEFGRIARAVNAQAIHNFDDLDNDLNGRIAKRERNKGTKTKIEEAERDGREELMDAATIMIQNVVDGNIQYAPDPSQPTRTINLSEALRRQIEAGNYRAIDQTLALAVGGDTIFNGIGERIHNSIVTTPEVNRVLGRLQLEYRSNGEISERALKMAEDAYGEWYDHGGARPSEIALVQEYVYYAGYRNEALKRTGVRAGAGAAATGAPAGGEVQGVGGGSSREAYLRYLAATGGRIGAGATEGMTGGSAAAELALMQESLQLQSTDDREVKRWACAITDYLIKAYGPQMFSASGGWQTLRTHLGTQITSQEQLFGGGEALHYKLEREVLSIATVRYHEAAIFACDQVMDTYLKMLPSPEALSSELWNKEKRRQLIGERDKKTNALVMERNRDGSLKLGRDRKPIPVFEGDKVISEVFDMIMGDAYNGRDGGVRIVQVIRALRSHEAMDLYAENYAKYFMRAENWARIRSEYGSEADEWKITEQNEVRIRRELTKRARVAISIFNVDEYPRWAAWTQSNAVSIKEEERNGQKIKRISGPQVMTTELDGSQGWSRLTRLKPKEEMQTWTKRNQKDTVGVYQETWSSEVSGTYVDPDGKSKRVETVVGHPFFGPFFDPEALPTVKHAWNQEVRHPAGEAIRFLVMAALQAEKYGDGPHRGEIIRDARGRFILHEIPVLSDINYKQLNRLGTALSQLGGSYWDKAEDLSKTWDAVKDVSSMFSNPRDKEQIAGAVIGNLLASKIRANLESYNMSAVTQTLGLLFKLGDTRKEQAVTAGTLFGSDMSAAMGLIRDAAVKANLNIFTPDFIDAMKMAATGAKTPGAANWAVASQGIIIANDLFDAFGQAISAVSSGKSAKRR